jgi:hypothetical protein
MRTGEQGKPWFEFTRWKMEQSLKRQVTSGSFADGPLAASNHCANLLNNLGAIVIIAWIIVQDGDSKINVFDSVKMKDSVVAGQKFLKSIVFIGT